MTSRCAKRNRPAAALQALLPPETVLLTVLATLAPPNDPPRVLQEGDCKFTFNNNRNRRKAPGPKQTVTSIANL